jgi:molybdate transport system regulatory protein
MKVSLRQQRSRPSAAAGLRGRLQLDKDGAPFLGAGRIDLLEAIDRCGSITQAAKSVGLSYKAAWDAVDAMNNQADAPLVSRSTGGRRGGGTLLTDYGRKVLTLVRAIEGEYQQMLALLQDRNRDFAEYRRLMRRLSLQTSARNQWVGQVVEVRLGLVQAEVRLQLDAGTELTAAVSAASAERLGLKPGVEVSALVKAVATSMTPGAPPAGAAPNCWRATVSQVQAAGARAEVTATLDGGRTVTAVISAAQPGSFAVGDPVSVQFDPTSVLLVAL